MIAIGAKRHIGATSWVFVNEKSTATFASRDAPACRHANGRTCAARTPLSAPTTVPTPPPWSRQDRAPGCDPAFGDAVDDELNRAKRKAVADLHLMVQMGS